MNREDAAEAARQIEVHSLARPVFERAARDLAKAGVTPAETAQLMVLAGAMRLMPRIGHEATAEWLRAFADAFATAEVGLIIEHHRKGTKR